MASKLIVGRLETELAKPEREAQVKIDVAERFRLEESHVLESCRRDLDKAEATLPPLRLQRDATTAALKTLSAEAKPTIFGRKDYFQRLSDVENVVASAQEKVDVALVERRGAAKRVDASAPCDRYLGPDASVAYLVPGTILIPWQRVPRVV